MPERKQTEGVRRREERLRVALRENLKRRKAQARGRQATAERPGAVSARVKPGDEGSGP